MTVSTHYDRKDTILKIIATPFIDDTKGDEYKVVNIVSSSSDLDITAEEAAALIMQLEQAINVLNKH